MRLWSVHPKHLDTKGLVALWREGLLARKVLHGDTKGYRNHPQLDRFRATGQPQEAIECYLHHVVDEADRRGYNFDRTKLDTRSTETKIKVTEGQLSFEHKHLKQKLDIRDAERSRQLPPVDALETHPIFCVIPGPISPWERL